MQAADRGRLGFPRVQAGAVCLMGRVYNRLRRACLLHLTTLIPDNNAQGEVHKASTWKGKQLEEWAASEVLCPLPNITDDAEWGNISATEKGLSYRMGRDLIM